MRKSVTAHMTGRTERGRDRAVRRHSYDENTPEAQPWRPLGDGTLASAIAHREAILETAEELRRQQWKDLPHEKVREIRVRRASVAGEIAALERRRGREADIRSGALRRELGELDALVETADNRLREGDLAVLRALLKLAIADLERGRVYPTLEELAARATRQRTGTCDSLRRLHAHGLVDWHRRSKVKPGSEGQYGPQRETTSSAYFFDWLNALAKRVRLRFEQLLARKLRRVGRPLPSPQPVDRPGRSAAASNAQERRGASGALGETLARLEGLVARHAST